MKFLPICLSALYLVGSAGIYFISLLNDNGALGFYVNYYISIPVTWLTEIIIYKIIPESSISGSTLFLLINCALGCFFYYAIGYIIKRIFAFYRVARSRGFYKGQAKFGRGQK
jgi:hypothetical protein